MAGRSVVELYVQTLYSDYDRENVIEKPSNLMANSNLMNGIGSDTKIVTVTPWWKTAIIVGDSLLGVLTAVCLVMYLMSMLRSKNKVALEEESHE